MDNDINNKVFQSLIDINWASGFGEMLENLFCQINKFNTFIHYYQWIVHYKVNSWIILEMMAMKWRKFNFPFNPELLNVDGTFCFSNFLFLFNFFTIFSILFVSVSPVLYIHLFTHYCFKLAYKDYTEASVHPQLYLFEKKNKKRIFFFFI